MSFAEDAAQTHADSEIVDSVSVSPSEPCLVDSVQYFPGFLNPSGSYNSSPSPEFALLCLMFGCGSLLCFIKKIMKEEGICLMVMR